MAGSRNAPALRELYDGLPCGRLVLKLAASEEEKNAVFKLRFRVFNEELGEGVPENKQAGLDRDHFDDHCDHLMVLSDGRVVGTYRLLYGPQRPQQGFYTETEFNLAQMPIDFAHTVELGRGCIESEFRKQTTLMALFWGLHRYMMLRDARYLMGCASLAPMTNDDAEATFEKLRQDGKIDLSTNVRPCPGNDFKGQASKGQAQVPALIGFYLEFGARILGRPAYDPVFKVHDFLMAFDMDHLSPWGSELLSRFDKRLISGASSSESVDD